MLAARAQKEPELLPPPARSLLAGSPRTPLVGPGIRRSRATLEKVPQQPFSNRSQNRLGVELHPLYRQRPMAYAHDLTILCLRAGMKHLRTGLPVDGQGVVASRLEAIRQTLKDTFPHRV